MNVDQDKVSSLLDRAQEYVETGRMTEAEYQQFRSDINEYVEALRDQDSGLVESIGRFLGEIAGWIIRGGTIVEDFLTGGIGVADDIISFYLASKAPDFGAWVGRKIDNLFSDSGEDSMQINANTIVLDDRAKQAIEGIITKVASMHNIDNVTSVFLELTPENAVVRFKKADDLLGSLLGNLAGSLFNAEGIGQYLGSSAQELMNMLSSGAGIGDIAATLGGSALGSYLGRQLGDLIGIPGIGQYLGHNLGTGFGQWILSKFQSASTPEEAAAQIKQDIASGNLPDDVKGDPGIRQLAYEMQSDSQRGSSSSSSAQPSSNAAPQSSGLNSTSEYDASQQMQDRQEQRTQNNALQYGLTDLLV